MKERINAMLRANSESVNREVIPGAEIKAQFAGTEGVNFVNVGEIECDTGCIVIDDPMSRLPVISAGVPLSRTVPKGKYKVDVSVCTNDIVGICICTARLTINDKRPTEYVKARDVSQDVPELDYAWVESFQVDSGVMCLCDEKAVDEYRSFLAEWYENNPEGNHYDDYFAGLFAESYEKYPDLQRRDGDFICWENPKTGSHIAMITAGLGNGMYNCYYGLDENYDVCQIIVPMVDPKIFE